MSEIIPHSEALLLQDDPATVNLPAEQVPRTQYNTLQTLAWIKRQTGKTPTEIIEIIKKMEPIQQKHWVTAIAKKATTTNQQRKAQDTIRSLAKNNLAIRILPSKQFNSKSNKNLRAYTLEEAQRLRTKFNHPRTGLYHQLWVTMDAESGLRPIHLHQLQYKHIKQGLEANEKYIFLRLPDDPFRKTSKTAGYIFIGPASTKIIQAIRQINPDYLTKPDDKLFPFKRSTINDDMLNARDRAKIPRDCLPNNALRRFFKKALEQARIENNLQETMMGHLNGIGVTYTDKQDIDRLRKEYAKAYQYLNLDANIQLEEYKTSVNPAINQLQDRIKQLETEKEEMKTWIKETRPLLKEMIDFWKPKEPKLTPQQQADAEREQLRMDSRTQEEYLQDMREHWREKQQRIKERQQRDSQQQTNHSDKHDTGKDSPNSNHDEKQTLDHNENKQPQQSDNTDI